MDYTLTTLAPGLHRVEFPLGERFVAVYLIVGDTGALLFDTGVNGTIPTTVVPALAELGIPLSRVTTVVVSHCDVDHFGGVADAHEVFPGALVIAHPLDRPAMEDYDTFLAMRGRSFLEPYGLDETDDVLEWSRAVTREGPIDGDATDGQVIDLGGRQVVVRHVPGHSMGHLAIEDRTADALLVSDAILGDAVYFANGEPAFPPTYRHTDEYLATIDYARKAGFDFLLTAHYPVMRGDSARAFLDESEQFVARLERLVQAAFASASDGLTLEELSARVNPIAGSWPDEGRTGAMAFPVAGHLERLMATGAVVARGERNSARVWGTV